MYYRNTFNLLEVKIQLGILNQNYCFLFTICMCYAMKKFKDLFKVENQILWSQIGVINQALSVIN